MKYLIPIIVTALIVLVPLWRIFRRAGFPGAMALLYLAPFGTHIVAAILSFAKWPISRGEKE